LWKAQPVTDELLDARTAAGAGSAPRPDAVHDVSFFAKLLAVGVGVAMGGGCPARRGFFAMVLLSHALFFGGLAFTRFGDLFYGTASAVAEPRGRRKPVALASRPPRKPKLHRLA